MTTPLLSIIVPSFNQGQYLAQALAEPCSYPEVIEVIVIDGGSKDSTLDVIQSFGSQVAYWVSEPDDGQANAINRGFAKATGEWLAFQNSDDFYLPGAIPYVIEKICAHPDVDLIIGGTVFTDQFGKALTRTFPKPISLQHLACMNFIHNQSFFIRRRLLIEVGNLNEDAHFCLDYDWFIRIFRTNPSVLYVNRLLGAQRLHDDTKTAKQQALHGTEFGRFSRRHFSLRERLIARMSLPLYRLFRFVYGILAKQIGIETLETRGRRCNPQPEEKPG